MSAGTLDRRKLVRELPCFLVSAMLHLWLMLLLGTWLIRSEPRPAPLALAATLSSDPQADGLDKLDLLPEPLSIEQAVVALPEPPTDSVAASSQTSLTPAVEMPAEALLAPAELPLAAAASDPSAVLKGRDPRYRDQLIAREGGSGASETAVLLGLDWIARHQNSDGSWSLHNFHHAGECNGKCGNPGVQSDTAGTALALLPFLGAGQTHLHGEYSLTIARGLRWLIDHQARDGDLRGAGAGRMYAHGQATIALCEAFALSRAELLQEPAQKAIDFIVAAQHPQGGWRYQPGEAGDLSVVGWQMMALRSGQMAYLRAPSDTFLKANRFLNSVQASSQLGQYAYMPGGHPTPTMTAEGLLCRQYSGWRRDHPVLQNGIAWLLDKHLPSADSPNMYYWYYATQVMHHHGGEPWRRWNGALRDMLIALQSHSAHEAGSWAPGPGHDRQGGRLYMTALAICTLEVYYRHMPLYRRSAADEQDKSIEARPRQKARSNRSAQANQ